MTAQVYKLKHPIKPKSGEPIGEVSVRAITGKDMRLIDKFQSQPIALTLAMIDQLCQLADGSDVFPGFADELREDDIDELGKLVMPSDVDGPTTG